MSWHGYVPKEVHDLVALHPELREICETYGMLRKHEAGEMALLSLFHSILSLNLQVKKLEFSAGIEKQYTSAIESKLFEHIKKQNSRTGDEK